MAVIPGTNDNDNLKGTSEPDHIKGFAGSDVLTGSFGADTLEGGVGFDRAAYNDSGIAVTVILGGTGQGSGSGGTAAGDVLIGIENVTGSVFHDTIIGDGFANFLLGGGGFDTLKGGGGSDFLEGSGRLEGDEGNDTLRGGTANDSLFGGAGRDTLDGREGADLIDGGAGIDTVVYEGSKFGVVVTFVGTEPEGGGFAEGDSLIGIENVIGSSHTDFLIGEGVANELDGFGGDDVVIGNGGNDTLLGGFGADDLVGGANDDFMAGGFGADNHDGGTGRDRATYDDSSAGVFVDLQANLGRFGDAEGDTWSGIEVIEGSDFFDTILGDGLGNEIFGGGSNDTGDGRAGNDTLLGGSGDDLLRGGDGDDFLSGGGEEDVMIGGAGNDTYVFFENGDIIDEATGGSGIDTVRSSVSFSMLGSPIKGAVENVTLIGTANANASGNDLANVLTGNSGANRLDGGIGADTMAGGAGSDRYTVTSSGDIVDEGLGSGIDEIDTSVSIALGGAQVKGTVENVVLLGTGNINAAGNAATNFFAGNGGINVLDGGAGNDVLRGAGGGDFFVFASALNPATNVDTVDDYNVSQDTMRLENLFFTGLANGTLAAGAFRIGAAAADASDRIVYNDDTGGLFFDKDGTGAAAAVRFATLDTGLAMTNAEFFVI
jgi:serralysin